MKVLSSSFLVIIIALIVLRPVHGQSIDSIQENHSQSFLGGELKGMYISGATSIFGGIIVGLVSNGMDDHPRSGLPLIAGGLTLGPSSLLGLGVGALFTRNHSYFTRTFQLGIGMTYSSPIFSKFVPGNSHRLGINIRVLSNEIGKWRYNLGYAQFFSEEYEFKEIPAYHGRTNLSWWELNFDLQYLIYLNDSVKLYPFIGTQYNKVNSTGSKVKTEVLVNYGIGSNFEIYQGWSLFAELKLTLDPDDNPGNIIYSFGTLYYL